MMLKMNSIEGKVGLCSVPSWKGLMFMQQDFAPPTQSQLGYLSIILFVRNEWKMSGELCFVVALKVLFVSASKTALANLHFPL